MYVVCHNTVSCPKPIGATDDANDVQGIITNYLKRLVEVRFYEYQIDEETGKETCLVQAFPSEMSRNKMEIDFFTVVIVPSAVL